MKGMGIQFLSKGMCGSHFSMTWANVVKTQTVEVNTVLNKEVSVATPLCFSTAAKKKKKKAPEHDKEVFLFRKQF